MRNEILLIVSLVVLYAMVLLWYQLFGRSGMYCFTVFATSPFTRTARCWTPSCARCTRSIRTMRG